MRTRSRFLLFLLPLALSCDRSGSSNSPEPPPPAAEDDEEDAPIKTKLGDEWTNHFDEDRGVDIAPVALPSDDAPLAVDRHTAVWTGGQVIIWGGNSAFPLESTGYAPVANKPEKTGGIYDLASDNWRPIPVAPIEARLDHAAVWTGTEMLIFGGEGVTGSLGDGAAFDPAKGTWRTISAKGGPSPRAQPGYVWTGKELLVAGGHDANGKAQSGAYAYDPKKDAWRPFGKPAPRVAPVLVWAGSEAVIWGANPSGPAGERSGPSGTWTPLPTDGAPPAREDGVVQWAGGGLVVWGGLGPDKDPVATGAVWDLMSDSWSPTKMEGAHACYGPSSISTGELVLVVGEPFEHVDGQAQSLAIYDVQKNGWRTLPGPYPSADIALAWTGTELIGWGGFDGTNMSPTGERVRLR